MDCKISKDPRKEDHLYYNIQAIEICKKSGAQFTYSTSKDLKNDYMVVENVPEVIEELKKNGWSTARSVLETDWLNI